MHLALQWVACLSPESGDENCSANQSLRKVFNTWPRLHLEKQIVRKVSD